MSSQPTYIIPPPSSPNWKTPLLVGILVLLVASNVYLFTQIERVKTDNKNEMARLSNDLNNSVQQLRIESSASVQHSRQTVAELQAQLAEQRRAAERQVGQAKIEAEQKVQSLQSKVAAEQQKEQEAIQQVKQTADTATTKIADVSTDVGTVKTDVQSTKSQLEQTIANLKRVTGDVDNHSSLIATNGTELAALRALGERNYTEFSIVKSKQPSRVADVMVQLRNVNVKKKQFTIEVTIDDNKVEKKNRTIDEPIQFVTRKSRQPYEIVVNTVSKDKIAGYLAVPKVLNAR
ncbi:MAG TPA: hypothetical protein VHZ07_23520 [Bryobacteraceae bacterium]|jgi:chromosome segregation ATPase|nr:hypothetical protein [Bryobacteraceae bacterium]